MSFRLTAVLIGAIFVIGVVLLIRTFVVDPAAPDTLFVGLSGVTVKDVDEVIIERTQPPASLKLKRIAGDDWEITEPIRAKANGAAVKGVVESLLKAKPTVFAEVGTNPAVRGLEPPGIKVTLRQGDRSGTLNIGDVSGGGREAVVFVSTTAKPNRPIAVPRRELDVLFRQEQIGAGGKAADFAKWTADFRSSSVFPSDGRAVGEDVVAVRLELPNKKQTLALTRTVGGVWKFDSPVNWGDADVEGDATGSPGTFTGVRRLLGALTSVTAATPADFIDQPKDLKEYGLDEGNPDLAKVYLKTRDNQSVTVFFGKREVAPPPPAMPGAPPVPPSGKVYVRIEGQPGVIRATAGDLSGLNGVIADPSPLRDRTLVVADRAKVDGIDIALPGQPVAKLRQPPAWQLYGSPSDPQPASVAAVEKLLDVVLARRNIKDFPAPNPANFSTISATVSVWVDAFLPPSGKAEPAPKGKPEPIKLEFGNRVGDVVYVRRTGPAGLSGEFTLPAQIKIGAGTETADVLASVTKSRLDLLDPSLPTFGSEAVAGVTVSGASNYSLAKDDKPDPSAREFLWRYTAPEPKGRIADTKTLDGLLQLLGTTQSVTRFVDESPDAAKLAEYGFAPAPRLKIVVGLRADAPDKERVYEFGKDAADSSFVYARVVGKAAVFTLPRLVFDRFANPDLRDRVVFRGVPAATVNKVELRGWGDAGFVTELTFEKSKEGGWVATKAPAGYQVDPAKLNAFLELLTRERVKTFEKGGQEAKHGFADPKTALQVTLHWPGGAVALNLGASPDNGATYYGWSGWLPQTESVFTFEGAAFKPFKDKPGGFAK